MTPSMPKMTRGYIKPTWFGWLKLSLWCVRDIVLVTFISKSGHAHTALVRGRTLKKHGYKVQGEQSA